MFLRNLHSENGREFRKNSGQIVNPKLFLKNTLGAKKIFYAFIFARTNEGDDV